jgi:hypothetical protein
MAGVRGRAPLYRPSAKRWALSSNLLKRKHPQLTLSTNPKSHRYSNFSPCLTAGTGRHMATVPCSPTSLLSGVESSSPFTLSPTPLPVHKWRLCIHPQEAFSCASLCLTLPPASKKAQSGAVAAAIEFAIASTTGIASLHQSRRSVVVHHCGGAVVSCRLCLIACNSSQFDVSGSSRDR